MQGNGGLRDKRQIVIYAGAECSCDATNRCPVGPVGAPGQPGVDGTDGVDGRPGKPGLTWAATVIASNNSVRTTSDCTTIIF
jgi:hypothetical protein